MGEITISKQLDCKGLCCPMPVVKTKKAMKEMAPGEVLEMVATDPGSIPDMEAWARQTGNKLLEATDEGGTFRFLIEKKGAESTASVAQPADTAGAEGAESAADGEDLEVVQLDCKGLCCPMPVVKTKKAIKGMKVGQLLEMVSTDPGAMPDMEAWARQTGHELVEARDEGDTFTFLIKKTH